MGSPVAWYTAGTQTCYFLIEGPLGLWRIKGLWAGNKGNKSLPFHHFLRGSLRTCRDK